MAASGVLDHRVAVASVSYNTKLHLARLLFSLHHSIAPDLERIVIVDNGSTDGTGDLLEAVADAGLCEVIRNEQNRYHGPALNQAVGHLRETVEDLKYLWVLDSDCIVLDSSLGRDVTRAAAEAQAAVVGEAAWNRWHNEPRFGNYSLVLDVPALADASLLHFKDGGDPSEDIEAGCQAAGLPLLDYPFAASGRLIHVGRASLLGVFERGETDNPHFGWAQERYAPHFQGVDGAERWHAEFCAAFDAAVPDLSGASLVRACQRP